MITVKMESFSFGELDSVGEISAENREKAESIAQNWKHDLIELDWEEVEDNLFVLGEDQIIISFKDE